MNPDLTGDLDLKSKHKCDNCDEIVAVADLGIIQNAEQRLTPGSVVPSGECPKCNTLCYPIPTQK